MSSFAFSIPVGAYHPFLDYCLRSLLAQEPPVEIALLDASGDPRVRRLADQYERGLTYRRHAPDAGQSAAIIEGWNNTHGEILGWLNADDFLFPQALSTAACLFETGADLVFANSLVSDESGAITGYHWGVEPPSPSLLKSNIISQPSCFFLREAVDKVGGLRADLHYTMDWDLWIRLFESGASFVHSEETFSQVMWGRKTKTASFNKQRRSELDAILRKYATPKERSMILQAFARESRIDRLPLPMLRAFAARRLAQGRPTVRGLSGIGQICSEANFSFAHYHDAPTRGIRFDFADSEPIESIRLNDVVQSVDWEGSSLILHERVAPAKTIHVSVKIKPGQVGQFLKATWIQSTDGSSDVA